MTKNSGEVGKEQPSGSPEKERQPTRLYSVGKTLEPDARYELMAQPLYGFDCYGNRIKPENGYVIVPQGDRIGNKDKPWDVFAGWMESDGYHAENGMHARSRGRWTCWERPDTSTAKRERP